MPVTKPKSTVVFFIYELAKVIGQSPVTAIAVRTNEMRKPCLL